MSALPLVSRVTSAESLSGLFGRLGLAFDLIPDPLRSRWHGPRDAYLARSIVNVNLVYHSLLSVYGLVETLSPFAYYREGGEYHTPWGDHDLRPTAELVFAGASAPAVDAAVARSLGVDPKGPAYLRLAEQRLGPWREGLEVEPPAELLAVLRGESPA